MARRTNGGLRVGDRLRCDRQLGCRPRSGVRKLIGRRAGEEADVPVPGWIRSDVDTWEDYRAVRDEG
jgi:hypothetical protein